ncbi:MAG: 3-oxoadipate enol-lactonase [Roseibium sp.]
MQIAQLENADIHWQEDGDPAGYPVVFANSLGTDLRLWDQVVQQLPKTGYRFIRFDKRGHGLSSSKQLRYSIADLAGDTEDLLQHIGVSKCVFVGLSVGGMIGQSLASRNPELVSRLVLACSAARMGDPNMWAARIATVRENGLEFIADAVLERWFSPEFLKNPSAIAWRNMLSRTPAGGYIGCCEAIAASDLTAITSELRLPVLGIGGSHDGASPPQVVKATSDLVPDSRFVEINDAGHLPCVEQPDVFSAHLVEFLREETNAG